MTRQLLRLIPGIAAIPLALVGVPPERAPAQTLLGQNVAPAEQAEAGAEVLELERAIAAALIRGDVEFVDGVLAPDFVMVHGDGWTRGEPPALVDDRASFMKRVSDRLYAAHDYEVQAAEMHGDVAITYGRYIGHIPNSPPGRRWFYVWYQKVYAKRGERWQYLSHRTVDGAHYGDDRSAVSSKKP